MSEGTILTKSLVHVVGASDYTKSISYFIMLAIIWAAKNSRFAVLLGPIAHILRNYMGTPQSLTARINY